MLGGYNPFSILLTLSALLILHALTTTLLRTLHNSHLRKKWSTASYPVRKTRFFGFDHLLTILKAYKDFDAPEAFARSYRDFAAEQGRSDLWTFGSDLGMARMVRTADPENVRVVLGGGVGVFGHDYRRVDMVKKHFGDGIVCFPFLFSVCLLSG